ncbi:unnamed protein product [Staurois parvus]|uniref:Uncharacterized protein n=1 Tax=Staurois parvus TaxID=386267 RepID=A0ABN9BNF1_9NEOB|nr:unnamed protein product [Staurois parvus]
MWFHLQTGILHSSTKFLPRKPRNSPLPIWYLEESIQPKLLVLVEISITGLLLKEGLFLPRLII